jgi:RNAse (barnase) inhibitor barstar
MKPTLEIDGTHFDTLEGFYDEVSRQLIPSFDWGHNLDAFDDILHDGFGTPEGFVLVWRYHDSSRASLGYDETVRQLRIRLGRCHPSNVPAVRADLETALRGEGPTVFDWLIEMIRVHGPGGKEAEDGIELLLR